MFQRALLVSLLTAITAIGVTGCGQDTPPVGEGPTLKIVSSLPLTGGDSAFGTTMANAIRQAVDEHGPTSGRYRIVYVSMDDASAARGSWDPAIETANATNAAGDPTVLAYLGTYNSGAAKIAIPILNQAGPLLMLSPGNTYPGLTKPIAAAPGEPGIYYPTGIRNYARVNPADDIQVSAGADWAKQAGFHTAYVVDDAQLAGLGVSSVFRTRAAAIGLNVLGSASIPADTTDYTGTAATIAALHPDVLYYAGVSASHPGRLLRALQTAGWVGQVMGADGIANSDYIRDAGALSEGTFATFVGLPPDQVALASPAGKRWLDAYVARFGAKPEAFGAYAYEAATVTLAAIDAAVAAGHVDRRAIRDRVFATKNYHGVLGETWSFDANGDTSITTISQNVVKNGVYHFTGTIH